MNVLPYSTVNHSPWKRVTLIGLGLSGLLMLAAFLWLNSLYNALSRLLARGIPAHDAQERRLLTAPGAPHCLLRQ